MALKVCHFTSTHSPKDQRIFYKECISLAKEGYEVYLVEQGEDCVEEGVTILGTHETEKGRFYRLLKRPKKVYKIAKSVNADIYHFHDMELIPYAKKLKKKGKKVIFDYHEDYASRFAESDALPFPKFIKKLLQKMYCSYENAALKKFDAVISVTPHICERLSKVNPKTYMVTNYPLADSEIWNSEINYNAKSDYVAFAGQVSETYRLPFIAEAIQDIKGIKFKMCGPLRKSDDLDKIEAADVNGITEYLGKLPFMELPDFLRKSRLAFVLYIYSFNTAGHYGTLGSNKLFEAMLCGVPVVCTDYVLWKQIVEKHKCGICVNSYDKEELKRAVEYILDNPEEARKMGERGRKAVLSEYNWQTQVPELLKCYSEL